MALLSGIRVVDFSRVLAGPLCARTLQDLGAEVIKIEPPSPDVSRFAFPSTDGMSGYYAQQNAGKRNVSINLNVPGAYELALKLCDTADIVVENFRAGTLGFFGLDYETLSKRNPRLIYASITGYGQGGPWRSRMAYAPTVQAEAGFTENSVRHYGEALTEPRTDSLSHADVYAGLQAVIAILAALNSRQTTGQGQYIDVAMAATLLAVNERAHVDLSDDDIGAEPAVLGATDCSFFTGPQGEHFTVATSIIGSRTFPSWLRAMRRADLMDDPRFSSAAARRLNFGALHQIIQSWMLTFPDMATLDAQFDEAKIAMGEIRSIKELTKSEWSDYWGAVQLVPDRSGGEYDCRAGLGIFPGRADADRRAGFPGRAQHRGLQRARRQRGGIAEAFRSGRARCASPCAGARGRRPSHRRRQARPPDLRRRLAEKRPSKSVLDGKHGSPAISDEGVRRQKNCETDLKRAVLQQGMFHRARHGSGRRPLVDPDPSGSLLWHANGSTSFEYYLGIAPNILSTRLKKFVDARHDDAHAAARARRSLRIRIDQERTRFLSGLSGA